MAWFNPASLTALGVTARHPHGVGRPRIGLRCSAAADRVAAMPTLAWSGHYDNRFSGHLIERLHNVPGVNAESHIYVEICETRDDGTRFIGNAVMTVQGVAPQPPRDGDDLWGITIRVFIDWEEDLPFRLDIIVVNDDE
jgi:hypothetical protein